MPTINLNPIPAAKSFAHLLTGRGTISAKKAEKEDEDEKDDKKAEKEDDDKEKAEDKKPPADDKEDGKKGKKSAGKNCEDEDEDADEGKKGKKAEKDEEDEEDEDDKKDDKKKDGKKASADCFHAETLARCRSIFEASAAASRPDLAAELAFNSQLSAEQAISLIELAGPAAKGSRLSEKMSTVKNPDVGSSDTKAKGDSTSTESLVASMLANYEKATS